MPREHPALALPPQTSTDAGAERRLGVELEFSGLDLTEIAELVREHLGGEPEAVSDYEVRVVGTRLGDFQIELDFAYLKHLARETARDAQDAGADDGNEEAALDLRRLPAELLGAIARHVVPFEIVSPPLPMTRAHEMSPLIDHLREAGARGTRHSPLYAFGLHLNPEAPATDSATVLAYLQAYLCLHDWLVQVSEVDWSRRLTPYIKPFSKGYVQQVIAADYAPGMAGLIDDYLTANPERNRALDLLPLFAEVDEARVRAVIDDARIKSRPAFHYRLPNCDIDLAGWNLHAPWRHWLEVERLAHDDAGRAALCGAYAEHLEAPLGTLVNDWAGHCEQWLSATNGH